MRRRYAFEGPSEAGWRRWLEIFEENHIGGFKRIDVLVNNAGKQIICKDFAEVDLRA